MPTMTENPYQAIHDALWRKLKDFGPGGGAELLAQWADLQNPSKRSDGGNDGDGLTRFELSDSEDGGFPTSIVSAESPALYVGSVDSQQYTFAPGRSVEFPELFEIVGCVTSRSVEPAHRFLWLVQRALWWDFPRLIGDNAQPLPGIKSYHLFSVTRKPVKQADLFWKFTITVEVTFCVRFTDWTINPI